MKKRLVIVKCIYRNKTALTFQTPFTLQRRGARGCAHTAEQTGAGYIHVRRLMF